LTPLSVTPPSPLTSAHFIFFTHISQLCTERNFFKEGRVAWLTALSPTQSLFFAVYPVFSNALVPGHIFLGRRKDKRTASKSSAPSWQANATLPKKNKIWKKFEWKAVGAVGGTGGQEHPLKHISDGRLISGGV